MVDLDADITTMINQHFVLHTENSDYFLGGFAGLQYEPFDWMALDAQVRFIDENAVSVKVLFKY